MKKYLNDRLKLMLQAVLGHNLVWKMSPARRALYLTFDDGPNPKVTPQVLDLLERHGVKGTFFLVGDRVLEHPELALEMHRRGHRLAGHSCSHAVALKNGIRDYDAEVSGCLEVIASVTGQATRLYRPPWGTLTWRLLLYCLVKKVDLVLWSLDSMDFKRESRNSRLDARPGDIVLLHDDAEYCLEILEAELPRLIRDGFQFLTL